MWESLMMIPPLLAGNKPIAFFATEVFVRLNGYKLNVRAEEAHRFLISLLEQHRCTFAELLPWIRTHAVQL
jgi:death-on-curing protein